MTNRYGLLAGCIDGRRQDTPSPALSRALASDSARLGMENAHLHHTRPLAVTDLKLSVRPFPAAHFTKS